MSENVGQTCNDSDGVSKQAVNGSSHQSVWMAHWMNSSSCKPTTSTKQACDRLSICYESPEEDGHDPKQDHLVGGPKKPGNGQEECENRSSEIAETKPVKVVDENLRSSFPMFNLQRKWGVESARKDDRASSSHWESIKPQIDNNDTGYQLFSLSGSEEHSRDLPSMIKWLRDTKAPSRENPIKDGYILENRADVISESSELAKEKSTEDDFVVSSSKVVPYGFNFGKTPVQSLRSYEKIDRSSSVLEPGQRVTNTVYQRDSLFLVHNEAVRDPFEKSSNPLVTYNYTKLLPRDPSTSRSQQPEFAATQYQKRIQDHSGIGLFQSKNSPVDLAGPEKHHGCLSLPSPPCMGAVGTCTTVDSLEESSRRHNKFSTSTTPHFLFTKANFNLTGGRMVKESMVSTELKEEYSPEPFHFNQDIAFPIRSGVKLQLLGSPMGSEGEKDAQELKTSSVNIRNESSSQTNTMDLETFRKNHVSGVVSSSSNKRIELEQPTPASKVNVNSAREIGGASQKRKFPDINRHPNDDVAVRSSSADTSTSRTHSLDAEHLLSNAEKPTSSKFNARPVVSMESEPSRWVKRLKTSSTSACGTQSSKMGDDGSHEKVNSIFSKIVRFTITSSDPVTGRSRGKQPVGLSQRASLFGTKSPSADSARKDREVALSHPWIRRLCQNAVPSSDEKSKAPSVSGSQRSKPSTGEPEKKQFPSLVAMALMGRALRGYSPCKLRRKGSSVVWGS